MKRAVLITVILAVLCAVVDAQEFRRFVLKHDTFISKDPLYLDYAKGLMKRGGSAEPLAKMATDGNLGLMKAGSEFYYENTAFGKDIKLVHSIGEGISCTGWNEKISKSVKYFAIIESGNLEPK